MRSLPLPKLVAAIIVLTVVMSAIMVSIPWNGNEASTAAPKIDDLLNVMIVLSSFVFSIVMVMMVYSVWRWRAKPGDESDGAPIHGNTRLEIAWTAIPTVIVLFGAIYSWTTLSTIEAHDPNRMVVDVYSQQYEWHFDYPQQGTTSRELHVPVNRQIEFRMHALDVIHSFWVPEWRIKKDNVPGITTRAYITPTETGHYTLVCTELCGIGHSTMRAPVVVEKSQADFDKWAASQPPIKSTEAQGEKLPSGPTTPSQVRQ
ncbi:MAG: cytochrome c oxidase subunit II [Solirubrobacterales bacterium]